MQSPQSAAISKGQLISKANCQAVNSSKIRFYYYASGFLEEIEDTKKRHLEIN